jgi:hypothetical protein
VTIVLIGLLVLLVVIIVTNPKRWRAVRRGLRQTRTGFEDELRDDEHR